MHCWICTVVKKKVWRDTLTGKSEFPSYQLQQLHYYNYFEQCASMHIIIVPCAESATDIYVDIVSVLSSSYFHEREGARPVCSFMPGTGIVLSLPQERPQRPRSDRYTT